MRWGCRLVWSRLVASGAIDPGSNPGSPTSVMVRACVHVMSWFESGRACGAVGWGVYGFAVARCLLGGWVWGVSFIAGVVEVVES